MVNEWMLDMPFNDFDTTQH